jgi:hypothetical protein
MQDVLTRVVRDLGADARSILETMLGRKLAEEEQVTVMAFAPRPRLPRMSGGSPHSACRRLWMP